MAHRLLTEELKAIIYAPLPPPVTKKPETGFNFLRKLSRKQSDEQVAGKLTRDPIWHSATGAHDLLTVQQPSLNIISTADFVASFVEHPALDVSESLIDVLPTDVWLLIISLLPYGSLFRLSRVCRGFRNLLLPLLHKNCELHNYQIHPFGSQEQGLVDKAIMWGEDSDRALYWTSKHIGPLVKSLAIYVTYVGKLMNARRNSSITMSSEDESDHVEPQHGLTETVLQRFASYHSLQSLDLSSLHITPFHVHQIFELHILSQLSLDNCTFDERIRSIPCSLKTLKTLKVFSLKSPQILQPFCSPSVLEELVYRTEYDHALFAWFAESGPWTALRSELPRRS
jgi:hypothetical protein